MSAASDAIAEIAKQVGAERVLQLLAAAAQNTLDITELKAQVAKLGDVLVKAEQLKRDNATLRGALVEACDGWEGALLDDLMGDQSAIKRYKPFVAARIAELRKLAEGA